MSEAAAVMHDHEQVLEAKTTFGFWVYLMTDCILFATLFATYAVLHNNTYGGPSGAEIFKLPYVFVETMLLLTSSFTCGLAMIALQRRNIQQLVGWLIGTFLLGGAFLAMELAEFSHLAAEGHSWTASAFMSAFFTLVGTHGAHIMVGLLWILVLVPRILRQGITSHTARRLALFSLFWHFLDVVWIMIFTIVYLMGALHV
jgi:cytochrome o ubiquinol oxidase subunit 3